MVENNELLCNELLRNEKLLNIFLKIPHKILHHHEHDALASMILHEIGSHLGFNRATYLVDNPDFGCLKGVAGFCKDDCKEPKEGLWDHPEGFEKNMEQATFYSEVKKFMNQNVNRMEGECDPNELVALGERLGIQNPQVFTWNMRHGNTGILIFDHGEKKVCKNMTDVLKQVGTLLSLCSV